MRHGGLSGCCGQVLPRRYLYVELAMAGSFAACLAAIGRAVFFAFMPFIVLMAVIFLTDMQAFIIPDWASLGGPLWRWCWRYWRARPARFGKCGARWGGQFFLIYLINAAYKLWRGHDGMGFGDVKLMAMLGVWLGPISLLPILFAASLSGAFIGIMAILAARGKNANDAPAQLPFGCF